MGQLLTFGPSKYIEMNASFVKRIAAELEEIRTAGLFKTERIIASPQGAEITVNGKQVLNFCANNYLGLSSHPKVTLAAHKTIDHRGYGMSSVRFICGTQDIHRELEKKIATFLGTEDSGNPRREVRKRRKSVDYWLETKKLCVRDSKRMISDLALLPPHLPLSLQGSSTLVERART